VGDEFFDMDNKEPEMEQRRKDFDNYPVDLGEAPFVLFPKSDGGIIHKPTGVILSVTWRGMGMWETLHRFEDDLAALLEEGVFEINPAVVYKPRGASQPFQSTYVAPTPPTGDTPQEGYGPIRQYPDGYVWEPYTDREIKTLLADKQATLSKNENTKIQIAAYATGCKVKYSHKKEKGCVIFLDKNGLPMLEDFWDNRDEKNQEDYRNPFDAKAKGWNSLLATSLLNLAKDGFSGAVRFNAFIAVKPWTDKEGNLRHSFSRIGTVEGWQVIDG